MKNYKSTLYGAVAYCAIIGTIYVALSVIGLMTRWCIIDSRGSSLAYMIYLLYFRLESCEANIQWDLLGVDSEQPVDFPFETDVVRRTFIFLIVYLGLHAALVVTCLYGLCGVNNSCIGRRSFPVFFVPWLIILVAIIVLDILATVFYVIDTIALTSVDGLIDILEVENADDTMQYFGQISAHYRYLPPIIMLITAAKLFVLLLVNIAWVVAITRAGWAASTFHKYIDETRRNYENTMASVNPTFDALRDDMIAQKQDERQRKYINDQTHELNVSTTATIFATAPPNEEPAETRYKDTSKVQQEFVYQATRNEKRVAPPPPQSDVLEETDSDDFKIKRPSTLFIPERQQRPPYQQQHSLQNSQQHSSNNYVDRDVDLRLSRFQETSGSTIKTIEPIKYDDIPEQQQLDKVLVLPPISESNRSSLKPIPPPKPQNNRYTAQPMIKPESPILYRPDPQRTQSARVERTSSNLRAPDELRSQLPWSYFKPRDETPKKAFTHLEEDEDVPAVPVPDYTLHYGRMDRKNLDYSDSDAHVRQRY